MPFFKVKSRQGPHDIEFEGIDLGTALAVADRYKLVEADLWQDGSHRCTIRRDDDASQLWIVAGNGCQASQ